MWIKENGYKLKQEVFLDQMVYSKSFSVAVQEICESLFRKE